MQAKTGMRLVIRWTDELRAIVEHAMQLHKTDRARRSAYVFAGRFTWHDLRAKALTNADAQGGNAQVLAAMPQHR